MYTIRVDGNRLELSNKDGRINQQLPEIAEIEQQLSYNYRKVIYGGKYDVSGYTRGGFEVDTIRRRLYGYNVENNLVCGSGFLERIVSIVNKYKIPFQIVDVAPEDKKSNRDVYTENWESLFAHCEIREGQEEVIAAIAANTCGMIKAATGFGKGDVMRMICHLYPKAVIHVTVVSSAVARMLVKRLLTSIPGVGFVGDGSKKYGKRVTVFTAGSLHHGGGQADFLLGDEGQQLAAPSYSRALAAYHYSRNFLFSATPQGRLDNADLRLESVFGGIIVEVKYGDAVQLGRVVPIDVHWHTVESDDNPVSGIADLLDRKRYGIWGNEYRNRVIASTASKYAEGDRQVLILVDTTEHALRLGKLLPDFSLIYGDVSYARQKQFIRMGLVDQDWEPLYPRDRISLLESFEAGKVRRAIGTAPIMGTGLSLNHLEVLVRADGGSSEIPHVQYGGRLSRLGKEKGILVDFVDKWDDGFRKRSSRRRDRYAKEDWGNIDFS